MTTNDQLAAQAWRVLTHWEDCNPPADLANYMAEPLRRLRDALTVPDGAGVPPQRPEPDQDEWEVWRGYGVRHRDGARLWAYTASQMQAPHLAELVVAMLNNQIPPEVPAQRPGITRQQIPHDLIRLALVDDLVCQCSYVASADLEPAQRMSALGRHMTEQGHLTAKGAVWALLADSTTGDDQ